MIKMESLVSIWIAKQVAHRVPLSKMIIQAKAKSLFDDLKSKAEISSGSNRNIFNVDETALFWKRLPARTYIYMLHMPKRLIPYAKRDVGVEKNGKIL